MVESRIKPVKLRDNQVDTKRNKAIRGSFEVNWGRRTRKDKRVITTRISSGVEVQESKVYRSFCVSKQQSDEKKDRRKPGRKPLELSENARREKLILQELRNAELFNLEI